MVIDKRAAGARGQHDREIPGFAIEPVMLAVGRVPGDLSVADCCRNGIDRAVVVVDIDLPVRPARIVGAGHGNWSGMADHRSGTGQGHCPNTDRQWPSSRK